MTYFTKDYIDFFTELAFNNEKAWFDKNKDRYTKSVKEPFEAFTEDVVEGIKKFDPDVMVEPNKSIYRIYRDVRFSKDKTPYKTYMGFGFGRDKKDYNWPGYTLGMGIENGLSIAGGMYMPGKDTLLRIRRALSKDSSELDKIANDPKFTKHWGEIVGDKNKILKPEFKQEALSNPWLYNKQWVYWKNQNFENILSDKLLKNVLRDFEAGYRLNNYLKQFCK